MQLLLVQENNQPDTLKSVLKEQGYVVKHMDNVDSAKHAMSTGKPEIIILDIDFPDEKAMAALAEIRHTDNFVPVLVLASQDSPEARNACFDQGADVYLRKSVAIPELLARLRVLERWSTRSSCVSMRIGNVHLDTIRKIVEVDGRTLQLPRKEYMLLKTLMTNAGKVQSRELLETHLYNWGEEVSSNALEVYIHHLRKKLGKQFIKNIRGVGYKIGNSQDK